MRKILTLLILLAVVGLGAALTRPSEAAVEEALQAQFLEKLAQTNPSAQSNGGQFALTLMCKADHVACYKLVRAGLDVGYDDKKLFAVVDIAGFGEDLRCYGAFTRLICPGEIPTGTP